MGTYRRTAIYIIIACFLNIGLHWTLKFEAEHIGGTAWADEKIEKSPGKMPKVFFPVTRYESPTVTEGTAIKYDFIVENHGQAPLIIEMVKPDCSCSVASNPNTIPAGGKDKISVVIHTEQKGGYTTSKGFKVTTNDPLTPTTDLVVSVKIESLIGITPYRVGISGYKGTNLTKRVVIRPLKSKLFSIKEIKASEGIADVELKLAPPIGKEPPKEGYTLTVSCDKLDKGKLHGLITMKTDMKEKPYLMIPVSCNIFAELDMIGQPASR